MKPKYARDSSDIRMQSESIANDLAASEAKYRFDHLSKTTEKYKIGWNTYNRINVPCLDRLIEEHPGKGKVVVLDTETTGLESMWDEVLSLTIMDASDGEILFDGLFKPEHVTSWPNASRVNKITPRKVRDKPNFKERLPEIDAILSNCEVVIGYNTRFDLDFLAHEGLTVEYYQFSVVDVMLDYAIFVGDHDGACKSYKRHKLTDAAYDVGVDEFKAHTAAGDCYATLEVYKYMSDSLSRK